MRAIHAGKSKNDRIDAEKIASLARGGNFPVGYPYPAGMRATRDLLRRRMKLVDQRAKMLGHIRMTAAQYNLPPIEEAITQPKNRTGLLDRFPDPEAVQAQGFRRPLVVMVGEDDTAVGHAMLLRSEEAMRQGPHRHARGIHFYEDGRAEAERMMLPFRWRLVAVPNVGHSNRGMARAAAAWLRQQLMANDE